MKNEIFFLNRGAESAPIYLLEIFSILLLPFQATHNKIFEDVLLNYILEVR